MLRLRVSKRCETKAIIELFILCHIHDPIHVSAGCHSGKLVQQEPGGIVSFHHKHVSMSNRPRLPPTPA